MENQRVRLSKTLLKNALIELLNEKRLPNITISELCNKATVNRTTFYKYYKNQYDLFMDIEQDIFDAQDEILGVREIESPLKFGDLRSGLEHIQAEGDKYRAIMNTACSRDFAKQLFRIPAIREITKAFVHTCPEEGMDRYVRLYIYAGCYEVIREWVLSGCKESPESIQNILEYAFSGKYRKTPSAAEKDREK